MRWLWAIAVAAACKAPEKKTYTVAELRADVLAQVHPLFGRPQYAITDPAFVDPCIAPEVSQGPVVHHDAVWRAGNCVERKLLTPEGLALVEAKAAASYANPTITRTGGLVTIDSGLPPGKLTGGSVNYTHVELSSPMVIGGEWARGEMLRVLALGMAKFPDAKRYEAVVTIPGLDYRSDWIYAYDRTDDRLHVKQAGRREHWNMSPPLGGKLESVPSTKFIDLAYEKD